MGWFPAKFVELIDERSKEYSQAGDDKVTQAITGELICTLFYYIINQAKRGGGDYTPLGVHLPTKKVSLN